MDGVYSELQTHMTVVVYLCEGWDIRAAAPIYEGSGLSSVPVCHTRSYPAAITSFDDGYKYPATG